MSLRSSSSRLRVLLLSGNAAVKRRYTTCAGSSSGSSAFVVPASQHIEYHNRACCTVTTLSTLSSTYTQRRFRSSGSNEPSKNSSTSTSSSYHRTPGGRKKKREVDSPTAKNDAKTASSKMPENPLPLILAHYTRRYRFVMKCLFGTVPADEEQIAKTSLQQGNNVNKPPSRYREPHKHRIQSATTTTTSSGKMEKAVPLGAPLTCGSSTTSASKTMPTATTPAQENQHDNQSSGENQTQGSSTKNDNEKNEKKSFFAGHSLKTLIKTYGLAFAMFYWVSNEIIVCCLTYLLYYDYIGGGDVVAWIKYIGADKFVDVSSVMSKSVTVFGYEISAKFISNFSIASATLSLCTPIQIPICIAIFPRVTKVWQLIARPFRRKKNKNQSS